MTRQKNGHVAKKSRWELHVSQYHDKSSPYLSRVSFHSSQARSKIYSGVHSSSNLPSVLSYFRYYFIIRIFVIYVYFLATYYSVLHADGTIRLLLCGRKVHCKSTWNFTPWFSNSTALGASPVQLQVLVRTNKPCRLVLRLDGMLSCVQVLF